MNFLQRIFTKSTKTANLPYPETKNMGRITLLPNYSASWIDIQTRLQLLEVFKTIPELNAIINYSAQSLSKLHWKLYSTYQDGEIKKEIHGHPLLDLLENPNPLQAKTEFLIQFYQYWKVFGNGYIYIAKPAGMQPDIDNIKGLYNLPSQYITPIPTNLLNPFTSIQTAQRQSDLIKYFEFDNMVSKVPFAPDEIIHKKDSSLDFINNGKTNSYLEGQSFIFPLVKPLTNIQKAYEAENVLIQKFGALGILSNDSQDSAGTIPMTPEQIKDLQTDYERYGIGESQFRIIITNASLKWQQMSLPMKDLMLSETIKDSMIALCNGFQFPILLMNYLEGSTFSNLSEAKKSLYQDKIIPEANSIAYEFNSYLKLAEQKLCLKADFSHVECLQTDQKLLAEKNKINSETILAIQKSIANGYTSPESAIAILTNIFEMNDEYARLILGNTVQGSIPPGAGQKENKESILNVNNYAVS